MVSYPQKTKDKSMEGVEITLDTSLKDGYKVLFNNLSYAIEAEIMGFINGLDTASTVWVDTLVERLGEVVERSIEKEKDATSLFSRAVEHKYSLLLGAKTLGDYTQNINMDYYHRYYSLMIEELRILPLGSSMDTIDDTLVAFRQRKTKIVSMMECGTAIRDIALKIADRNGYTRGVWNTKHDDMVRESHEDRDGKEFTLSTGCFSYLDQNFIHPMEEVGCRCSMTILKVKN